MKDRNLNITAVIRKSINKYLNSKKSILIILCISIFIVGFPVNFFFLQEEIVTQRAYREYGSYQCGISNLTFEQAENIASENEIEYAISYSYKQKENYFFIYGDSKLLQNTEYSIMEGTMPEKRNELLCEKFYLYQQGIDFKEDTEIKIVLNEQEYLVTGIVKVNSDVENIYTYTPVFVFNKNCYKEEIEEYSLVLRTKNENYTEFIDEIAYKYNLEVDDFFYNTGYLSYVGKDKYNNSNEILRLLYLFYYIMITIVAFIACSIIKVENGKLKVSGYTFISLGTKRKNLIKAYSQVLAEKLGICIAIVIVTIVTIDILYFKVMEININVYKSVVYMLGIIVIFSIVLWIISIFQYASIFYRDVIPVINNRNDIKNKKKYKKKSILLGARRPFISLAKANITLRRGKHILLVIIMSVSMLLIVSYSYLMSIVVKKEKTDFDYRINIYYDNPLKSLYGTDELRNKYIDMQKHTRDFEIFPVNISNVVAYINGTDISDEYVDYLKSISVDYRVLFENYKEVNLEENFVIIGADDKLLKNMYGYSGNEHLKSNQCIIIKNVKSPNNTGFKVGIGKGYDLKLRYYDTKEEESKIVTLNVVDTMDELIELDMEEYYMPIVFVSMELFNKIESKGYPDMMYVNRKDMSDDEIYEYFKGIGGLKLTNVHEERKTVDQINRMLNSAFYIMYITIFMLFAINCYISVYEKFKTEKKQIAVLEAIGVPKRKNFIILAYGLIRIFFQAILFGTLISVIGCYLLYLALISTENYFIYRFPWEKFIVPELIALGITGILFFVVYRFVKNIPVTVTLASK